MMLGANFLVMVLGTLVFWARLLGTLLNCAMAIFLHIPAIAILYAVRNNPLGDFC